MNWAIHKETGSVHLITDQDSYLVELDNSDHWEPSDKLILLTRKDIEICLHNKLSYWQQYGELP